MNYQPATQTNQTTSTAGFPSALTRLQQLPGVMGIAQHHATSRDDRSTICLTCYLDPHTYRMWVQGSFRLPHGLVWIDQQRYHIQVVNITEEANNPYDSNDLWLLTRSEILHDPKGMLRRLYAHKLKALPKPAHASSYLFSAWWHFRLVADFWIERRDTLQAHLVLGQSVTDLVHALFIINREFIPNDSRLMQESYRLAWKPPYWKERLLRAMSAASMTLEDVTERQNTIEQLWQELEDYLFSHYAPLPAAAHSSLYDSLDALVKQRQIHINRWKASLNILEQAPLCWMTSIGDSVITCDLNALVQVRADAVLNWHQEVITV